MNKKCSEEFFLTSNIKYLRKVNKESQEKLANVINKKYTTIGNYEAGIRNPDWIDIYYIAKHYNISIDDLIKKDLRKDNNLKYGDDRY